MDASYLFNFTQFFVDKAARVTPLPARMSDDPPEHLTRLERLSWAVLEITDKGKTSERSKTARARIGGRTPEKLADYLGVKRQAVERLRDMKTKKPHGWVMKLESLLELKDGWLDEQQNETTQLGSASEVDDGDQDELRAQHDRALGAIDRLRVRLRYGETFTPEALARLLNALAEMEKAAAHQKHGQQRR